MDYEAVLSACGDAAIGAAVADSLRRLFEKENQLLALDASERAIAAKLALYLQPHFPDLDLDVEYNRMGEAPKKVKWREELDKVYPDIIVHRRNTAINVLAIELKKDSNPEKKGDDVLKLTAYRRELHYGHALFLRLGVRESAGTVSECEWVK